jgi:hypothetical protein
MKPKRNETVLASPGLDRLRNISWLFDELIRIPGTNLKVGLDALLGLLPGGGDLVGGAVSAYAIVIAQRLGAPPAVIGRMTMNILIDAVFGAVPLLGDLFDASWKANRRNLALLEEFAVAPAKAKRGSMTVVVVAIAVLFALLIGIGYITVRILGWIIAQF